MTEALLLEAAAVCLGRPLGNATLARLSGGGNNRTYRLVVEGRSHLLKHYFSSPGDTRDRLKAEFDFSAFAWRRGLRCLPEPLGRDDARHVGLYEFIEGRKLEPGEVGMAEVTQALAFLQDLNRHRGEGGAQQLPEASEACFSLAAHGQMLDRRLARLRGIEPTGPLHGEVRAFVEAELVPLWTHLKERLARGTEAPLPASARILSPSDFGFHNALRHPDGRLTFLDFEYAGWDDPAKTVCDFFCQVALPVPPEAQAMFSQGVAADLPEPEALLARIEALMPLYRLKWICIVLNAFLPVSRERRAFAAEETRSKDLQQFERAKGLLEAMKGTAA